MKRQTPETLARLEYLVDSDIEWWPFVSLRPEPRDAFSNARCALLACLYGAPPSLLGLLVGRVAGDAVEDLHLFLLPLLVWAATFVVLRYTIARFWNQRAEQLRYLEVRRHAWQGRVSDRPSSRCEVD